MTGTDATQPALNGAVLAHVTGEICNATATVMPSKHRRALTARRFFLGVASQKRKRGRRMKAQTT